MRLTVHLVRHGQTLFNSRDLVQGWVDSPLTPRGWAQARAASEHLADRPLAAIFSSTSERAVDTAETIATHHPAVPVQLRRGLEELHFGDLEARPNDALHEAIGGVAYFERLMVGEGAPIAGGESPAEYRARVATAIADILDERDPGDEVVIVSHGVTINMVLHLLGGTFAGPMANGSVSSLTLSAASGWTLDAVTTWNPGG